MIGCAGARPTPKLQATLYRDIERLVTLGAATGWSIDRYKIDEIMPAALESVCRVPEIERRELLTWIDAEIMKAGGPIEVVYRERGEKKDKIEDLLELHRIKLVLSTAVALARDDCPFWMKPSERFSGRQLLDDRFVLSFGGGGKGIVIVSEGDTDLSAGGAGQLLFGRAFGPHWMISSGIQIGASATFPKDDAGARGNLVLTADIVAPVVFRYRIVNSYFEFQGGYLAQVREDTRDVTNGLNVGVAVGAQAWRARWFLPGVAFGVSVERLFPDDGSVWVFKAGFRAAIDLSL